jgi:hypothetical protein
VPSQRQTNGELPEVAWRGPFGGIQSEMPPDGIEGLGFTDVVNMIFRKSNMTTRFGYTKVPAIPAPNEPILGIADFFTDLGLRVQVIMTPTRLIQWNPGPQTWSVVPGPALTGPQNQFFSWSVLDYQLAFSQGVDQVMLWDGSVNPYAPADPVNAVPGRYLGEFDFHLMVGYTFESGVELPQRLRWTGAFSPADWTSYDSGFVDLTNNLGPITGLADIYQTGFIFQQRGIVQANPTGIGTQPFDFVKISNKAKGNIAPFSLDYYGDQMACYVGKDNIYLFDGTQSYPLGDAPLTASTMGTAQGRVGARKRIFAELKLTDLNRVFGFITTSLGGNDFNAYWLIIPGGSVWVYQFDEACWTRFMYDSPISCLGDFVIEGIPTIGQLIGTIAQQTWSPATLTGNNPLDALALGRPDGVVGYSDFSNYSETPWSVTSGQLRHNDSRHTKYDRMFRTIQSDTGVISPYNISISNQLNVAQNGTLQTGNGTGKQFIQRLPITIDGQFINFFMNGSAPVSFSELAFHYDISAEVRT